MGPRKLKTKPFRKMKFPIEIRKDSATRQWCAYDKEKVIVASNMTKSDAETTRDSLNYIGKALGMLVDIVHFEKLMVPNPKAHPHDVYSRVTVLGDVYNFLLNLGVIEEPKPDYSKNVQLWGESLMQSKIEREEPEWTVLYHLIKDNHIHEIDQ